MPETKKKNFESWTSKSPEPVEVNPLYTDEEANAWAEEMREAVQRDNSPEVQDAIRTEFGQEIDRHGVWYQRIDFPEQGLCTTSNHAMVPETPGSLNRIGDRLTPMEASIMRPWPKWKYIERVLPPVAGKSVLEIGSANGFFATRFAQMGASQVTGVELMGRQVQAASWAADALGLDQLSYKNTDILTDQSVPPHDIVFLSEVHNHFPLPFLGLLRLANLAKEFLIFDNSGVISTPEHRLQYKVVGDPEEDKISYIHCSLSQGLMIHFFNMLGIDNEAIVAYVSPDRQNHVLYVVDVREMRQRRLDITYPNYLRNFFEHF